MTSSIELHGLKAVFNHKGAELISLKKLDREFIWNGNPLYWDKHSPVLFPIVGTLKNNQYTYNNQNYTLSRHGFARDMEFELIEQTQNSLTFSLKSNDETLKNYPFAFEFQIIYSLQNSCLITEYKVINANDESMFFSLGAHPAFALPNNFEDYSINFDNDSALKCNLLENGLLSEEFQNIDLKNGNLDLNYSLFENDALIFKNITQKSLTLVENDKPFLKVNFEDFPDLGIWTKINAPFICIEPWFGHSDLINSTGNLTEKTGIIKLESHSEFTATYSIEILS